MAGLRGKRVKRFKSSKIEELEEHCMEKGFLDVREELTPEQRFERVVRSCEAELSAGTIEATELRELADRLADYLEAGLPEAWDAEPLTSEDEPSEGEPSKSEASGAASSSSAQNNGVSESDAKDVSDSKSASN